MNILSLPNPKLIKLMILAVSLFVISSCHKDKNPVNPDDKGTVDLTDKDKVISKLTIEDAVLKDGAMPLETSSDITPEITFNEVSVNGIVQKINLDNKRSSKNMIFTQIPDLLSIQSTLTQESEKSGTHSIADDGTIFKNIELKPNSTVIIKINVNPEDISDYNPYFNFSIKDYDKKYYKIPVIKYDGQTPYIQLSIPGDFRPGVLISQISLSLLIDNKIYTSAAIDLNL